VPLGKGGAKHHCKILRENIQGPYPPFAGIPPVLTLCRYHQTRHLSSRPLWGVKCISGLIYKGTHSVLKIFLKNVICDSVTYTEHAKR
jgi:histone H4